MPALGSRPGPLDWAGTDRFVPWILAPMVFLATLTLALGMTATDLLGRYAASLTGTWTVEIPPAGDVAATAAQVQAALGLLAGAPGVTGAAPLGPDELQRLLSPWLGEGLTADLPLPALIDLRVEGADRAALEAALGTVAPGARVDDHGAWLGDLRVALGTARLVAFTCLLLIALAVVATIVVVARSGLAVHGATVELLHIMGASDAYVARQFQRRALALAGRGCLAGAAVGLATLALLGLALRGLQPGLLPEEGLSGTEWAALLLVPVLAAALATVTARVTVLHGLARLP
jgi:cell division transport system permease protein